MKVQIRQGVFETNSSSTHSLVVSNKANYISAEDIVECAQDGVLTVALGEFGWEIETYASFLDKLSYVATYAHNYAPSHKAMLESVVRAYTGLELEYANTDDCYIDHQSIDVPAEAFASESDLHDFLFNKASYFETDNDNH